jgi:hypothetical protein
MLIHRDYRVSSPAQSAAHQLSAVKLNARSSSGSGRSLNDTDTGIVINSATIPIAAQIFLTPKSLTDVAIAGTHDEQSRNQTIKSKWARQLMNAAYACM